MCLWIVISNLVEQFTSIKLLFFLTRPLPQNWPPQTESSKLWSLPNPLTNSFTRTLSSLLNHLRWGGGGADWILIDWTFCCSSPDHLLFVCPHHEGSFPWHDWPDPWFSQAHYQTLHCQLRSWYGSSCGGGGSFFMISCKQCQQTYALSSLTTSTPLPLCLCIRSVKKSTTWWLSNSRSSLYARPGFGIGIIKGRTYGKHSDTRDIGTPWEIMAFFSHTCSPRLWSVFWKLWWENTLAGSLSGVMFSVEWSALCLRWVGCWWRWGDTSILFLCGVVMFLYSLTLQFAGY